MACTRIRTGCGVRTRASRIAPITVRCLLFAALIVFGRAEAVPLEVYGRLPTVENVAISPDGTRLAFVRTLGDDRLLAIVALDTGKPLAVSKVGKTKLRGVDWADNKRLLIVTSVTTSLLEFTGGKHEWFMLQVYDLEAGKMTGYPRISSPSVGSRLAQEANTMNVITSKPVVRQIDGHTTLFLSGLYVTDRTLPALFRVDLDTHSQKLIRQGTEITMEWIIDGAGEIAAEEDYYERDRRWSLRYRRDGKLQEAAFGHEAIDLPQLLGFGPSEDTLLLSSRENGDSIWRLFSLKDGSLGQPMAQRASLEEPIEDRRTHRMIGGVHTEDDAHFVFFDPATQKWWDAIVRAFANEHVELVSASEDFKRTIVRVDGPQFGYTYQLVDMNTHKADIVGDVYDGIAAPLPVQKVAYEAADGLPLSGYLTLPKGKAAKHLPLVVLAHGGPAARDTDDFDWWSQALADQGYAVLRPNFRGSDVTMSLMEAGYGEWGRKMQTDLSDGVRYLVKQDIVDPERVCIVGGSYGGYAALAGVTLDPGVYRCAVSVAGLSDLHRMLNWEQSRHAYGAQTSMRYWDRFMGATGASDPNLDTISPVKHLDAVTAPVMLIHGRDDTIVPFEQSQEMYDALKHANKPVELVELKHEDHWLSSSETRLHMLQASVAFLRRYNPPDP